MKELCSYSKIIAYFWDCIPKISPLFRNWMPSVQMMRNIRIFLIFVANTDRNENNHCRIRGSF